MSSTSRHAHITEDEGEGNAELSELFWDKVMKEQGWGMAIDLPAPFNGIALMAIFALVRRP